MPIFRSSIFSFDTLRLEKARPKGFFRALALTLALVFVAEVGARLLVHSVSPYCEYWEDESGFRFEAYRQHIMQGAAPNLVIIGDSTARFGIDLQALRTTLPAAVDSYNLATPANYPMACHCTTLPLLNEPYAPPKVVIALFSPYGFLATDKAEAQILNSPICKRVESPFSFYKEMRLLWLMRVTPYVKNSSFAKESLKQTWAQRGFTPLIEATPEPSARNPSPSTSLATSSEIKVEKIQVIRDLALLARNRNFKFILVIPPLRKRDKIVEEMVERMGYLQDELKFTLLDFSMSPFLSTNHFLDGVHVNKDGAAIFSQELGKRIYTQMPELALLK
ncbi:MAG: hypothetical protein HY231_05345 [Acidobacteria bacterium]|nr:hypothetical protein [Acidobacteriota bacterium]